MRIEENNRKILDLSRLDEGKRLEQFIHSTKTTRKNHERLRIFHECRLAHKEIMKIDGHFYKAIAALFEGQFDIEADGARIRFLRATIPRLHDAGPPSRDNCISGLAQYAGNFDGRFIMRISGTDARRAKDRHRWPKLCQRVERFHEFSHDAEHTPCIRFGEGDRLALAGAEQLLILRWQAYAGRRVELRVVLLGLPVPVLVIEDLDLAATLVKRNLEQVRESDLKDLPMPELRREPKEETEFVTTLFRKAIQFDEEHEKAISAKASNWESDRIALSDMILMKMALTEVRVFDQIPVKVTLNEYIEIAKAYSTPKSKNFINGVLDKLFIEMKADGRIHKVGRGLLES